jgi:hypothetical protein
MSKQTAVDWLYNNLKSHFEHDGDLLEVVHFSLEQAKAMEKEQIINTYKQAQVLMVMDSTKRAEQYYYETYESNGSDDHLPDVREMVEISDEDIIKLANEHILYNDSKRQWVIEGMKLYREQLKKK